MPEEIRLELVIVFARLLAFLFPPGELASQIDAAGEMMTGRDWMDEVFWDGGHGSEIIANAKVTAENPRYDVRDDPWKRQLLSLLAPTEDEMVRLKLRSLRTDAVRKKIKRRAEGSVERRDYIAARRQTADHAANARQEQGISERTERRRRKLAASSARLAATSLDTAYLSWRGLCDVVDFMHLFFNMDDDVLFRLSQGPLPELVGQREASDAIGIVDFLAHRAEVHKSFRLGRVARLLARIQSAGRADEASEDMLKYVLVYTPKYLEWAHANDRTERLYSVSDLLELATAHPDGWEYGSVLRKLLSQVPPPPVDASASIATQARFPGAAVAGCSRATWYRREKALAVARLAEEKRLVDERARAEDEAKAKQKRALW